MRVLSHKQGTEEWLNDRIAIPTASNFDKIITSNGEPSKQRRDYMFRLAAERLSGRREDTFSSAAMDAGTEREDESRWVYAAELGVIVEEVGLCLSDCGRYGASPDGLVDDNGLIELKNPIGKTQIERLLDPKLPTKYIQQVQGQLLVTGRDWCDFVSYYPGLPLMRVRVEPDKAFLIKLEAELVAFCDELDEICEQITSGGMTTRTLEAVTA